MTLTRQQELEIRAEADKQCQNHGDATCHKMAFWAQNEITLTTIPVKSTITRVLSLDAKSFDSGCRTGKHHAVEKALYMWICDMYNKRTNIKGMLIKSKTCKLMSLYNERPQHSQKLK